MKNAQTFCNKMIGLTSLPNQERITAVFNRLICDYYSHERNAIQQLRTIRQTRIRFSLAVGNYEITSRQADYVLKLLKAEEELLKKIEAALNEPVWDYYLGSKCCIPAEPVCCGICEMPEVEDNSVYQHIRV